MKRLWCLMVVLALIVPAEGFAEALDDAASLRELLTRTLGDNDIAQFDYGDYDGDGTREAFALVSDGVWDEDGVEGEIWFVNPDGCTRLHDMDSYLGVGRIGVGPCLYTAEIWYGGSGSTSAVWGVDGSAGAVALGDGFEGIEGGDIPNEFHMYPSAFDLCPDGTGHTWKRYYFFLDGLELKEYGGRQITRQSLEEYDGAAEILEDAEAEGWQIGEIYYRANGVINVNLHDEWSNDNLTLRVDGYVVMDTGERYGGVYEAASGLAEAVYP